MSTAAPAHDDAARLGQDLGGGPGRALYLPGGVFALHHAAVGARQDTAVLLVPPFGWEDICSYRSRRRWAQELAAAGHPVLRIDLPGTGDSAGGPHDEGLVARWQDAIGTAVAWLRAETGCPRVAAIGLGLGGLLACAADVDDLVLWGTPAAGRRVAREWKAFAAMQGGGGPELVVNGYLVTNETLADVSALSASSPPALQRALLLGRDGLAADKALAPALAPAEVTTRCGTGWNAMVREPQEADPPLATIAEVGRWLAAAPAVAQERCPAELPATTDTLDLDGDVRETPVRVLDRRTGVELFGILAEPLDAAPGTLTAVLLNAGPQRHTGPNRMWVEAARRWAAAGTPALRIDLQAIGDADGDEAVYKDNEELFTPELVGQARLVLQELADRGLPSRFHLQGLCAGGAWGMRAAAEDPRVAGVLMLNPQALVADRWVSLDRRLADLLVSARDPAKWRRAVAGDLTWSKHVATLRTMLAALWRKRPSQQVKQRLQKRREPASALDPVDALLDQLEGRDQRVTMLFTGGEPLHREWTASGRLARIAARPAVDVVVLGDETFTHTLQPLALQREVGELADRELARSARALSAG